jgi:hypothetical protein
MRIYVNGTRLRQALERLPEAEGVQLVRVLFPRLGEQRAALLAQYPGEARVNGAALEMPVSWDTICGDVLLLETETNSPNALPEGDTG